jgi:hypothetical protein
LSAASYTPGQFARHLSRAIGALTIGDSLADPVRPSRRDVGLDAALAVYGQGLFWALTADAADGLPAGLDEAWAGARPDVLAAAADDDAVHRAMVALARSPLRRAEMTDAEQEADLGAVRTVLRGLIRALQRRRPSRKRLAVRRWVRAGLVGCAAVLVIVVGARLMRGRDLAAGKPVIASSVEHDCDLSAGICQGQAVDLFVHTHQEESPWVRIDLQGPQKFSSITVTNRRDCCEERAVPLILETGNDGVHFMKVAEQRTPFAEWKAKFPAVTARYVRARVPRNTMLHLARIEVR